MLDWLICYLNSNGYYFNDSNYCYYENSYRDYHCNYSYNNHQPYNVPARRQEKRRKKSNSAIKSINQGKQVEIGKGMALEDANLKKGLETKITEDNKGYELLVKMGYENGKGLGKNAEGVLEPLMLTKKFDRKGLGAEAHQSLATIQVKLTPSKYSKPKLLAIEDKIDVAKPQSKQVVNENTEAAPTFQELKKTKQDTKIIEAKLCNPLPTTKADLQTKIFAQNSTLDKMSNLSVKDPRNAKFFSAVERKFSSEIDLMQKCYTDSDLLIAKICIENDLNIDDEAFEFIRTELVSWIGVYQHEGMDTPIFHSITNDISYVTIVCDNKYAFECVQRCVQDFLQMKTLGSIKILPLPQSIYCFDAKYAGIVSDTELFLLQLRLHKPKLYSDNWIVVSHEVCPDQNATYFIFLIDERSALALNFHYSQSFCVCLQEVTFRKRGIIRETVPT